jgi:acetyl-CoA carboxylase carboxyltransferase component
MDPETGVNVVYGMKREDDPEAFEQRVAELARDAAPWELTTMYEAQEMLDPRETRRYLIDLLEIHTMRMENGVGEHHMRTWPTSIV